MDVLMRCTGSWRSLAGRRLAYDTSKGRVQYGRPAPSSTHPRQRCLGVEPYAGSYYERHSLHGHSQAEQKRIGTPAAAPPAALHADPSQELSTRELTGFKDLGARERAPYAWHSCMHTRRKLQSSVRVVGVGAGMKVHAPTCVALTKGRGPDNRTWVQMETAQLRPWS
eukprot:scaffold2911_cov414-Prasinococcus_capsulatus_cf.AAC.3